MGMSKQTISIIHAADLHLGAPFRGIAQAGSAAGMPAQVRDALLEATFNALDRLVDLCLARQPLALLLAGDLYNPEGGGLKSLNALQAACLRLNAADIAVIIIHGNHDPLSTQPAWQWPPNTHVFGAEHPASLPILLRDGKACPGTPFGPHCPGKLPEEPGLRDCALIVHGISHYQDLVTDNLALAISRHTQAVQGQIPPGIPCVGLAHCAVGERASAGESPYAPCSIADLAEARLDYWALGHIHKRGQVSAEPTAWYSGNIQGLHINESGLKGCLEVEFAPGAKPQVQFHPLAPVAWANLEFTLHPEMQVNQMQAGLLAEIGQLAAEHFKSGSQGIIVRIRLCGRSKLHTWLHQNQAELAASLQSGLQDNAGSTTFVWVKDIILETLPALDLERAAKNAGLLGEALRGIARLAEGPPEERAQALLGDSSTALGRLFNAPALRQAGISAPDDPELLSLLAEAGLACVDLLGAELATEGETAAERPADGRKGQKSRDIE